MPVFNCSDCPQIPYVEVRKQLDDVLREDQPATLQPQKKNQQPDYSAGALKTLIVPVELEQHQQFISNEMQQQDQELQRLTTLFERLPALPRATFQDTVFLDEHTTQPSFK